MRPLISWADLAGRRVGVWGPAGVEGQANVRKLAALGVTPAVLVDDSPSGAGGPGGAAVLATADGGLNALAACDVVVKAPGISRYREDARWLAGRGVAITGGVGLWLAGLWLAGWADGHVIAITGTKGKSSTTAVAGHLLTRLGYPAMTGGNIGRLPYDPDLDQAGPPPRYWVIEVSSYQALDLPVSAPVTAVTSLHPDHLPWHGGVGQYYADKLSACSQPGAEVTVANGDSDLLRERAALLGPRVEWVSADDDPGADWMAPLGLLGAHSRRNALIARACLRAAGVPEASDDDALRSAAGGFTPLPSRLQVIGTVGGAGDRAGWSRPQRRARAGGRREPQRRACLDGAAGVSAVGLPEHRGPDRRLHDHGHRRGRRWPRDRPAQRDPVHDDAGTLASWVGCAEPAGVPQRQQHRPPGPVGLRDAALRREIWHLAGEVFPLNRADTNSGCSLWGKTRTTLIPRHRSSGIRCTVITTVHT